jgi:quercetin dioxygenase-like cupin family protein
MKVDHYESGNLYGVRYEMGSGEELPKHTHPITEFHNVCVLKGSVTFWSEDRVAMLTAGNIFDFDGTKPHVITALEPTVILNLYRFGKPPSAMKLSEAEKHFNV